MTYKETSNWDEKNEIRCLIIFKKLQEQNFPRNRQMEYCREIANIAKLDASNLSAKVSNYKSVAGINKPSHASINTIEIFKKYKNLSIDELEQLL